VHLDPGFTGDQTALRRHVLYESGNDPWRVMLFARLPMIALTVLFGLVVFAFARDLAGAVGGVVALALYAFSPDVIAHGSLATLDVPAAGFLLTSVWLLWRARGRPFRYLPPAGLALGAALATRMNTLAAAPVLLLLAAWSFWSARRTPGRDRRGTLRLVAYAVGAAVGVALVSVAVVWAAYLAVDPRPPWTTPRNVPDIGGKRGLVTDCLPVPEPYRDGMRIQFGIEYATKGGGFLFGRRYRTLAQGSTLQGGGVGHPEPSGLEGRSDTAKVALSDNVVGGPTAGLAGRQACGDLVRPPSGGRGR